MRAFAHDVYTYPLPDGHRFPLAKYRMVREGVGAARRRRGAAGRRRPTWERASAHAQRRLGRSCSRRPARATRELALGLPWSPELVERSRRATGATIAAACAALDDGVAMNLGGGTHHAFAHAGRGFCVFNDVVTAIRDLRATGRARRVLVVDVDVHQGDGTHSLLGRRRRRVHALLNGFRNYPFRRVPGDLDVELPDGTGDDRYLTELRARAPGRAVARARPELCFVLAGADPYEGDRLGRLALTKRGLRERDEIVRDALAGGRRARVRYARRRLRGGHPRHGRDQPGHGEDIQRIAVVTGASSGIGEATARLLAEKDWRCVLVARREDRLRALADEIGGEVEVCDVADRAAVEAMAARVLERHPAIHLLVNNAGMPARGTFLTVEPELIERVMRRQLPRRRLGHASAASGASVGAVPAADRTSSTSSRSSGTTAFAPAGAYSASKHAQLAFSRSLAAALRGSGVAVHSVLPGFVETEGFPQKGVLKSPLLGRFVIDAPRVAEAVVGAVEKGKREVTVPVVPVPPLLDPAGARRRA